jgi:hypothetical protein
MESDETPVAAPPVIAPNLYVVPFRSPYISRVVSADGKPVTSASTILIQGTHLMSPNTFVFIEGQEFTPTAITDTQLTLPIPAGLHAGVKGLQVLQKLDMGTPAVTHRGFESNVAPFVLCPTVSSATALSAPNPPGGTNVTVKLVPNIGVGQRAVLLLNQVSGATPAAFSSPATVAAADSNQVVLNIDNVSTGSYLVRIQIDGAESLLTVNSATKLLDGPSVNMP